MHRANKDLATSYEVNDLHIRKLFVIKRNGDLAKNLLIKVKFYVFVSYPIEPGSCPPCYGLARGVNKQKLTCK